MIVTIQNAHFELDLCPSRGGSLTGLRHHGIDVLRPALPSFYDAEWDPKDSAAFPMVPFIGRISNGCFTYSGETVELPPNMVPEPHAIHGFGWKTEWTVAEISDDSVSIAHTYSGPDWPWPYISHQHFKLTQEGLELTLELQNLSNNQMPAGFGWHPYFPSLNAKICAPTSKVWTGLNSNPAVQEIYKAVDLSQNRPIKSLNLDTAFDLSSPKIEIETQAHRITLLSDSLLGKATIFTPSGEDFFCAEPISHAPDALNMSLPKTSTGLQELAPGDRLKANIVMKVTATS